MTRNITLHVFCSVKGGVGKSTLATTCATLLATRGRVPLLVDADLTGTSLADGLRLCAPRTALRPDGTVDVEAAPTGEFFTYDDVVRLRRSRRDSPEKKGLPPVYLNDALRPYLDAELEYDGDVRVDALFWRHAIDDGVWYLPSSALRHDMAESVRWLSREAFDWMGAMMSLLDRASYQWPEMTDVVIDVPPGLFGFGQEMLALASMLMRGGLPEGYPDWKNGPIVWDARAFLVTTPDRNDVLPAYEYMAQNVTKLLNVRLLMNKSTTPPPSPEGVIGPMLGAQIDAKRIVQIPLLPATLGRIFVDGALRTDDDVERLMDIFVSKEA
jgi:NUBPL iron-transfer P-loop NTPase